MATVPLYEPLLTTEQSAALSNDLWGTLLLADSTYDLGLNDWYYLSSGTEYVMHATSVKSDPTLVVVYVSPEEVNDAATSLPTLHVTVVPPTMRTDDGPRYNI